MRDTLLRNLLISIAASLIANYIWERRKVSPPPSNPPSLVRG